MAWILHIIDMNFINKIRQERDEFDKNLEPDLYSNHQISKLGADLRRRIIRLSPLQRISHNQAKLIPSK